MGAPRSLAKRICRSLIPTMKEGTPGPGEHAIGSGTDAEAAAYVQLNIDGRRVSGVAFDHDTLSASLKAVLSALNRTLLDSPVLETVR